MAEQGDRDPFGPEERFDMRRLGRTALWALGAAVAMMAVGAAAQSETGSRRMLAALNALPAAWRPATVAANAEPATPAGTPVEADTRRLTLAVKLLSAERERLAARLEALERQMDVTGSLPPASSMARAAPEAAAKAGTGEPRAAGGLAERASGQDLAAADSVATRTEFGVDLGGEGTLDGLRMLWSGLKTQHAAALDGLRPLAAVRERGKAAGGLELRLIAGPLANAAAAARLCAALASALVPCQPATFEGQRLALR